MNSITNEGVERLLKISLDMLVGLPQGSPLEGTLFVGICNENILDLCVSPSGASLEGTLSTGVCDENSLDVFVSLFQGRPLEGTLSIGVRNKKSLDVFVILQD